MPDFIIIQKVCYVFSLELPRGDFNEYIQNTISQYKKKITLNYRNLQQCDFFKGPKNEFETSVVNEPSVFEPLKLYCISKRKRIF